MIAPPDRFENMLSQVETLQIVAISIMSVVCALLVVLIHALHRVGATIREFMAIFKPMAGLPQGAYAKVGRKIGTGEEKGDC